MRKTTAYALFSVTLFVAIGLAFIPQAGIEEDEALIASNADAPNAMLFSYVGALKSWVYVPVFRFWAPSPSSLRVPVVLFGGATVWLFYALLLRIASPRAAVAGCVLLSTDAVFLLTTCFDWGPVVLQHFLLVSGLLCLVRFHQESRRVFLALGSLQFGLALWDKALFIWILSGMAISALIVFHKELRSYLCFRNLTVAALAFCLGAAPFIAYNIRFPLITFRSNASYSTELLREKTYNLASALSGEALFGYLVRADSGGHPRDPQTGVERVSVWLSAVAGRSSGFFGYALLAALLLAPLLWHTSARRPMLFSTLAMLVAWLQMLFTKGAGNSAHHVILLWPFPALVVAVAFAEASEL